MYPVALLVQVAVVPENVSSELQYLVYEYCGEASGGIYAAETVPHNRQTVEIIIAITIEKIFLIIKSPSDCIK